MQQEVALEKAKKDKKTPKNKQKKNPERVMDSISVSLKGFVHRKASCGHKAKTKIQVGIRRFQI